MKKLVSVVLAATMLVSACSALAACGKQYIEGDPNDAINWDVDLSKPIKLRGYFPESGMANFGSDDTAKIIEQATGYQVEYKEQKGSGIEGAVDTILQNQQQSMNQFNFLKLNDGCYTPYLENGTFLDLTKLLTETPEGKVLYQLVDMMDKGWESVKYTDNEGKEHIYAIPDFGYVYMTDSALVWNMAHLKIIGFEEQYHHELPETLSEVTWALLELQKHFGSNSGYHALAVPGAASAEVNPIAACFEVPLNFYVDEDGKIQIKNKSPNMYDYVDYMNMLYREKVLSEAWNSSSAVQVQQNFADELHSVAYMTYWNLTSFVDAVKAKGNVAKTYGSTFGVEFANTTQNIHDKAIKWTNRIRGDGYTFKNAKGEDVSCKNQEKAMLPGSDGGVSYYTVIPAFMAENARYVIDYLAKKMEAFAKFFGGNGLLLADQEQYGNDPENFPATVHWYEVPTPEGAPDPKDYEATKEVDDKYTEYEDFSQNLCFIRPMKYSYTDTRLKANGGHSENGEEVTVTVDEPGRWVKITSRYKKFIADNSQYCTGTQAIAARVYCHLHEIGFNAWYYCNYFSDEDSWIKNPLAMAPAFKSWAPVNIVSRSHFLTGVERAIGEKDPRATLDSFMRDALKTSIDKNGSKYYYWSDQISDEMTAWYNAHKS